jgi:hypothetical protein
MEKPDFAESGLIYELMLENKARNDTFSYSTWDMILFEAAKKQENLTVYYNTVMYDCETCEDKITAVLCVQETTEMRYRFTSPVFADCTGNGTLGYYAGAEYRQGSESKNETGEIHAPENANNERMGNTIHFKARNMGHPVKFTPPSFAKKFTEDDLKYRMHSAVHKVDYSSAADPEKNEKCGGVSARGIDYGYFWIELMGESDDIITDYENIRDDLVASLYGVWDHIKNGGEHGAECYELDWVGMLPGMRESRRLVGDYLLTENDVFENRVFDDAVASELVGVYEVYGVKFVEFYNFATVSLLFSRDEMDDIIANAIAINKAAHEAIEKKIRKGLIPCHKMSHGQFSIDPRR